MKPGRDTKTPMEPMEPQNILLSESEEPITRMEPIMYPMEPDVTYPNHSNTNTKALTVGYISYIGSIVGSIPRIWCIESLRTEKKEGSIGSTPFSTKTAEVRQ